MLSLLLRFVRIGLALVFLGLIVEPAHAQSKLSDLKRGRELYAYCQAAATEAQKSYLAGYVMGSADASMGRHFCAKEPVSAQAIVDAYCKYLAAIQSSSISRAAYYWVRRSVKSGHAADEG